MAPLIFIACCAILGASQENLLANPGFEQVEGALPAEWNLFVQPKDGAYGRLVDDEAAAGSYSVRLHTPEPYDREPVNNWSQTILGDYGGKELLLRGHIKTREATEAAIWVQCGTTVGRRRVLATHSSSVEHPRHGAGDWAPVETRINVPETANFIVVRCVLLGRGDAWFDEVSLRPAPADPEIGKSIGDTETASGIETAKPPGPPDPPVAEKPSADPELLRQLLEAHEALLETNEDLRRTNQDLLDKVNSLQNELDSIREDLQHQESAIDEVESVRELAPPLHPVPPVVPHRSSK